MFKKLLYKFLGSANDRELSKIYPIANSVVSLSEEYKNLTDEELKNKTAEFKKRISAGECLDDILPEAFATIREASFRSIGLYPFYVQIVGGIILHKGMIAEMRTGEGKTLVATMPIYLNALTGKGVHVITVNDYLAKRDSEWMGNIYKFLGLSVGVITSNMPESEKKEAYNCDITYGTNHEFGFDYLRDNMKFNYDDLVCRPFNYAILDEVDSILIDEARTPLIISGASENSSEMYSVINEIIPLLNDEHYSKDEKERRIRLTESGTEFIENILFDRKITKTKNLYDISNAAIVHHIDKALTAHKLFEKDVHYLVKDNQVYIIDEFTGRIMDGRRYSDGLHQAIEAKEGVEIQKENQTLATITYQNYFRLYPKIAGMTGTAMTEADEFAEIYKLKVIEVPTNKPMIRIDHDDEIYSTVDEKYQAILNLIKECHERQQPVLVGTISIEKSEYLAKLIKKELGFNVNVLNAKQHEKEAYIIAQAGVPGAITIATNMAGRGTDIQLGGNLEMSIKIEQDRLSEGVEITKTELEKIKNDISQKKEQVIKSGGLYIIGTERHESRRIDNQLRGRSGRQGDVGASKFFLSLEDDLMRIFGGDRIKSMLSTFGFKKGEAITHRWLTSALEKAQKKVEAYHFDIRKNLLKYDDVMNEQRKVIYSMRSSILKNEDITDTINNIKYDCVESIISKHIPFKSSIDAWNTNAISEDLKQYFNINLSVSDYIEQNKNVTEQDIFDVVYNKLSEALTDRHNRYGNQLMNRTEKIILLENLDSVWKDHLLQLDHLRYGIGLRAYAHKDPLNEYKAEAFELFQQVMHNIAQRTLSTLLTTEFSEPAIDDLQNQNSEKDIELSKFEYQRNNLEINNNLRQEIFDKVGRNEPCPCGSGKKFKNCHGKL